MSNDTQPGFYGKLPVAGDFVSRNLPRVFIDFWDQWLQAAIENSRVELGEEWLNYYLVSPLWRFALSPGVCQENAWIGVLMPSVDKVGRYFPMTIAVQLESGSSLLSQCTEHDQWYIQAEKVLLDMISDDALNIEAFADNVRMLGIPEQSIENVYISSNEKNLKQFRYPLENIDGLQSLFTTMLSKQIQAQYSAYSIWWTQGSTDVKASFMLSEGMPPSKGYSDMITGEWDDQVWLDASLPQNCKVY